MNNEIVNKHLHIKDLLLCGLPILAFISMQYRANTMVVNASLILTFFMLILIWLLNISKFTANDFLVLLINIISITITLVFFPGMGVALNFLNLFIGFMIFNKVDFSEKAIIVTRVLLIVGILSFFITSSFSINYNWVLFYDKNGSLINNNMVSLILVALYIHVSTLLLRKNKKWCYAIVITLFFLCFVLINLLACRSAMLFFILYGILTLFRKKILKQHNSMRKLCITFLIVSFCIPIIFLILYNRIENFEIMGKNFFSGREQVWLQAYQQIEISPVFGSGTEFAIKDGNRLTESTHNMLLGLWKNLGIMPVVSLLFYYALNNRPKIETNIIISIIAITSIACFESFLMDSSLYLLFLLVFPGTKNTKPIDKNM
ncbi:MAG: O-antigen ligase family protein [Clostridia bacterium]|nr:O-antigen ligase family protein [Clostridia bacterium]